jgi:hypothetical protein
MTSVRPSRAVISASTRRAMRSTLRAPFDAGLSMSSGRFRRTVSQTASSCST